MRLQIEPTDKIVVVNGTECRMWRGVSEKGAKCFLFVATITVPELPGWEEFRAELRELPHPGKQADAVMLELTGTRR